MRETIELHNNTIVYNYNNDELISVELHVPLGVGKGLTKEVEAEIMARVPDDRYLSETGLKSQGLVIIREWKCLSE